ncbi:MAG: pentapeptide repeat-containing protein [Longicatena sp.]
MKKLHDKNINRELFEEIQSDCEKCCGLCCVALYFSKVDGFPKDKKAGMPCLNLEQNFKCKVHNELKEKQLRGCLSYDCFGAGQKVTQDIFGNRNWRNMVDEKDKIFAVYLKVFELHQILAYLLEASLLYVGKEMQDDIRGLIDENMEITKKRPEEIVVYSLEDYHNRVSVILKKITRNIENLYVKDKINIRESLVGKKFCGKNVKGMNASMQLLLAANFKGCDLEGVNLLGADVRDMNVCDADLRECVFLTQMQLNAMCGNENTQLPWFLKTPSSWE